MNRTFAILGGLALVMPLGVLLAQNAPTTTPSTPATRPSATQPASDGMTPVMREELRQLREARVKGGNAGATRPSARVTREPRDGFGGPGGGPHGDGPGGGGPGGDGPGSEGADRPPFRFSEEEWNDVMTFLKTSSPNRLAFFNRAVERGAGPERLEAIRRLMIVRYRQLQQINEADPELYNLMTQQFANEDQALGVVMKLRSGTGSEDKTTLESELKEIVKKIVANSLEEREKRIGMLKESVEKEETTLEEDKARSDELTTKRFEQILDGGPDALMRARGGRMGGNGGPPQPPPR